MKILLGITLVAALCLGGCGERKEPAKATVDPIGQGFKNKARDTEQKLQQGAEKRQDGEKQ